jgi:hypothetical protein
MPSRDQDYDLIAALHDQLDDIETYTRYLKDARDCDECRRIWTLLKSQAEDAVTRIRAEIQRHAVD